MAELGKLERVELRDVWLHEAYNFTPWLARSGNLAILSKELGLDLELVGQEVAVGPYAADIVCKDSFDGTHVLIENQLEKTDHSHLGQILTYASALEARAVAWIAARFTDEHRAAIDWLNQITHDEWQFFGLEIELWRIGNSPPAPKFNIICRPNDWSRAVRDEAAKAETASPTQAFQLKFWSAFRDYLMAKGLRAPKPSAQSWQSFRVGRTGFSIEAVIKRSEQQMMVRLYIICDDLPPKAVFRYLLARRDSIEKSLEMSLEWHELPDKKGSVIYVVKHASGLENEAAWPQLHAWLETTIAAMEGVFRPLITPLQLNELPGLEVGGSKPTGTTGD